MRAISDDPADVIEAAADALEVYGRCKISGQNSYGEMCVLGAVQHVRGEDARVWVDAARCAAGRAFSGWLMEHRPHFLPRIFWKGLGRYYDAVDASWVFNDGTDDDQLVIDTLRHCAKDIRNGDFEVAE